MLLKIITKVKKNKEIILTLSLFFGLFLGLINNVISTHLLNERDFGVFRLLQMSWMLGIIIFGFGYFSTIGLKILNQEVSDHYACRSPLIGVLTLADLDHNGHEHSVREIPCIDNLLLQMKKR